MDTPSRLFSRADLTDYGVKPPVYTQVCRELGLRSPGKDTYPVTLEEAAEAYAAVYGGKSGDVHPAGAEEGERDG